MDSKILMEKLKDYGADIDGIMERFMGDADFYRSCILMFLGGNEMEKLGKALKENDYTKAFEAAHDLKGVTGNVGLTPLYNVVCDIVEDLRFDKSDKLDEKYEAIVAQYEVVRNLIDG